MAWFMSAAINVQLAVLMSRLRGIWPNPSRSLGFRWGRLKTGTPPRLARKSIDFAEGVNRGVFHVEHGDAEPIPFSFTATEAPTNKAACYLMHTNDRVHRAGSQPHRRIPALQRPN